MGCAANGAPIWAASRLPIFPRWLLIRVLAYRLQADAFGGLDKSIQRILRSGREETPPLLSTGAPRKRERASA